MDIVTKETFKAKVQKLVEHFSDNEEYYKSKEYKEDHLRQEFINPFFKALGWDMDNEQGFAPQYREVIHEDRIEIEGKPKAPDYAFKVGSDRKFFVEAKASSVKVFSEIDPAFQLRRYAWSGQLPVSILTDFEEFSIYDTTIEPKHTDKSSVARVKYIYYTDYLKEIDYLWDTFSKEAVWRGSFDKFAKKEKKGSQLVDRSFLKEIELWRELIAKDIASNNILSIYELNSVVQKFIDRIIFLRIAEDRGVETYETLRNAVKSPDTYAQLLHIFKRADEKYNSSLFDLKKDEISTRIKISDKTLDRILNNLYYPKSPYEFSVIGVDILGSVYEQFLGKVIRLTKGGNAVIEEKPEVKKAGGVYYTPQYIVDYIVKNTVGELVKDKTPKDVAKLKIVDPACGSGSFLIGAYNYLLNWHHKYYVENDVEKNLKSKKLFKDAEGNYFLSTQEKKDILLNNIHGVDIDPQAVEVTKLSLALKMLEGENSETIGAQFVMFADRILPDLSSNIKCGNSLIGDDYYLGKQVSLLTDDDIRKINAFSWEKNYPIVFRSGGFDAVIGNPPYIKEDTEREVFAFKTGELGKYYQGKMDLWYAFACHAIDITKNGGKISFIATNNWTTNSGASILRKKVLSETSIEKFIDFSDYKVFQTASIQTMIFVLNKEGVLSNPVKYTKVINPKIEINNLSSIISGSKKLDPRIDKSNYLWFNAKATVSEKNGYITFADEDISKVLKKMVNKANTYLESSEVGNGIDVLQDFVSKRHIKILGKGSKVGDGILVLTNEEIERLKPTAEERNYLRTYYRGVDVGPYYIQENSKYKIIYADSYFRENIIKYPNLKSHIDRFKSVLTSVYKPYGLHRAREERFFEGEKVLCMRKTRESCFTYCEGPAYVSRAFMIIKSSRLNNLFLTGLLNSALINFWLYHRGKKQGDQLQVDKEPLLSVPIFFEENNSLVNQIISKTHSIVEMGNSLRTENLSSSKKELLLNKISTVKADINSLIFDLYGLEGSDIAIVDKSRE